MESSAVEASKLSRVSNGKGPCIDQPDRRRFAVCIRGQYKKSLPSCSVLKPLLTTENNALADKHKARSQQGAEHDGKDF